MQKRPMSMLDAAREFPNDYDLGEYLRANYGSGSSLNTTETHEMVKEYPNNYELGKMARSQTLHS
jgi:hypothetical protein